MRHSSSFAAACLVAACSAAPAGTNQQQSVVPAQPTVGARVEASGYWTILQAPDSPAQPRERERDRTLSIYAEIAGVSNEEAEKRRKQQEATRPEFERLMRTLRTKERGNYTDAELIHRPDWAYLIYFKRNPQTTLAKYTQNPRFKARAARYTEPELRKLVQPWIDRLTRENLFAGFGINARQGRADVQMTVSKEEFEAIARNNGWEPVPDYLNLEFDMAPVGPAIAPEVRSGIRILPQSNRNLGATNQAAISGKIVLRDGCFFVLGFDGKEQLAYFAREVGLGRDRQGYLALHTRTQQPRHLGRIGEPFTWAGPIPIDDSAPMVKELRAQCGAAPLMHVGIPDSTAMFNARWGLPRQPVAPPRRPGAATREPEPPPLPQVDSRPPPVPPPPKPPRR